MTIQDYIKKYELTLWRTWPVFGGLETPWMPEFFVSEEIGGKTEKFDSLDKFEIYANAEKNRFVSMNITRRIFRIVHYELIIITSEWQPAHLNFELRPL